MFHSGNATKQIDASTSSPEVAQIFIGSSSMPFNFMQEIEQIAGNKSHFDITNIEVAATSPKFIENVLKVGEHE